MTGNTPSDVSTSTASVAVIQERSTHRVYWGTDDSRPCYCWVNNDHAIGDEVKRYSTPAAQEAVAWQVGDDFYTSESLAIEGIQQWGPSGSIAIPLYAAPVAAAPALDLEQFREAVGYMIDCAETDAELSHARLLLALIDASPKGEPQKWCAWDRDECTVTLAFDTEQQVEDFINSHPSRNRVRVVDDSPKGGSDDGR